MSNETTPNASITAGRKSADEILARRAIARVRRSAALAHRTNLQISYSVQDVQGNVVSSEAQTAGFLLALGDSWFDYPFFDVLKLLEDHHGYNVESSAHRGDPLESIAYKGGQVDQLARNMEKVLARGAQPRAILLSGGGDDMAGREFGMLLNSSASPISGWNNEIVEGLLTIRIRSAYQYLLAAIDQVCQHYLQKSLPVITHGYDYPVPDGRGFWGGWPFPGPWLKPGFDEKRFNNLPDNVGLMHTIIDRFYKMLSDLSQDAAPATLHVIDLRNTLSTDLVGDTYQQWWDNELHPTEQGFNIIADKFAAALAALP
jgi:hypothetical protein